MGLPNCTGRFLGLPTCIGLVGFLVGLWVIFDQIACRSPQRLLVRFRRGQSEAPDRNAASPAGVGVQDVLCDAVELHNRCRAVCRDRVRYLALPAARPNAAAIEQRHQWGEPTT